MCEKVVCISSIGFKIYPKIPVAFLGKNTPKGVSFVHQKPIAMKQYTTGETVKLRRKLAKLKHQGLEGLSYAQSQIFKMCETIDCGSYICNLSTGQIEESYGLALGLGDQRKLYSVEELDRLTHPMDRKKIHGILEALYELGKEKLITSQDRLSCTYRTRIKNKHIRINRKSGLAVKESTGEVLNWSNLYALQNQDAPDKLIFSWSGLNLRQTELIEHLNSIKNSIFTRKELEVLNNLNNGEGTKEAVETLHISEGTYKKHLSHM